MYKILDLFYRLVYKIYTIDLYFQQKSCCYEFLYSLKTFTFVSVRIGIGSWYFSGGPQDLEAKFALLWLPAKIRKYFSC